MSNVVIPYRYLTRGGTAANLAAVNEVPLARELVIETDTGFFKIGDGSTAYNSLPYAGIYPAELVPYDNATSGLTAEDVQAALDELAAGKVGDAPSDGTTYGRKDGAWAAVDGAGAGALAYVTTVAVAGSAATSLAVSGLDLDTDGHYVADVYLTNATGSNASVRLFYNADTTNTNYDRQAWGFSGTTNTGGRANDAIINVLNASTISLFRLNIWVAGGRVIADTFGADRATTQMEIRAFLHEWRTVGTNVTGFTLSSTVANAIGVGSFVKLWKMTA